MTGFTQADGCAAQSSKDVKNKKDNFVAPKVNTTIKIDNKTYTFK